jgi:post-segregation antitoxin (ccd killing protein)
MPELPSKAMIIEGNPLSIENPSLKVADVTVRATVAGLGQGPVLSDRSNLKLHWQKEYAEFTAAYNATVQTDGLPLAEFRTF